MTPPPIKRDEGINDIAEPRKAVLAANKAVELANSISARRIQLYRGFVLCQRIEKTQQPHEIKALKYSAL
jgi:hypothetical protein